MFSQIIKFFWVILKVKEQWRRRCEMHVFVSTVSDYIKHALVHTHPQPSLQLVIIDVPKVVISKGNAVANQTIKSRGLDAKVIKRG